MTVVATANILYTLQRTEAQTALRQVLGAEPDLVALQEWYITRSRLLPRATYHWVTAIPGGNVVGARVNRFQRVSSRMVFLSCLGWSDRPDRFLGLEPPREVTVGVFRDLEVDRTVAMLSYHLVPGVQDGGEYRTDRPRLVRRHRSEVARLEQLITELQGAGHVVYAAGDSNFDGLRLAGLTSAWEGRADHPGTIGSATRKVDDVHGQGPASEVTLVATPSDHRAVIVKRFCEM